MSFTLVLVCLIFPMGLQALTRMKEFYSAPYVDFTFKSEEHRKQAVESNIYNPKNVLITDVDVWKGNGSQTVFVCMAKFKEGIPVTLATVTNQTRNNVTLLRPYPDWSWQNKCDKLHSVYRVKVDTCDRMWVLDSGVFQDSQIKCPPKLVIFNLTNSEEIGRHTFPASSLSCDSNLITITVDIRGGNCTDVYAYVADVAAFRLIVYDYNQNRSWVVANDYLYPNPFHGYFEVDGVGVNFMDGVFGLAPGPESRNKDRRLYFHPLSSFNEFWVNTSYLRNESLFANNTGACRKCFHVLGDTRQSQSSVQDMTDDGVLFSASVSDNSITSWNSKYPFRKENLCTAAKDDDRMQFISGLKVWQNKQLWIVSNKIQNYVNNNRSLDEVNYYILYQDIDKLLKNRQCGPKSLHQLLMSTFAHKELKNLM